MPLPKRPRLGDDDEFSEDLSSSVEPEFTLPAQENYEDDFPAQHNEYIPLEEDSTVLDSGEEETSELEETLAVEEVEDDLFQKELENFSDDVIASVDTLLAEIVSPDSSEVMLNGPHDVFYKSKGIRYKLTGVDFVDEKTYHAVINEFILKFVDTQERIGSQEALIEGQLEIADPSNPDDPPTIARVHVLIAPRVFVTIAKKAKTQLRLDAIERKGSLSHNMAEFLQAAARGKLTTVISGATGSGKTTLLEALSYFFDENDRYLVVEDTPELRLPLSDVIYSTSTKKRPGKNPDDLITLEWLVAQANRMRMDRIIVGETRGAEMAEFLLAANSGAEGSMTTLHAQNPRQALQKMAAYALKAPTSQSETAVNKDIASTVQLIIQTDLIDNKHVITQIEEISNTIRKDNNVIATTQLFAYNRATQQFEGKNMPSDNMKTYLAARGVTVEPAWFRNN